MGKYLSLRRDESNVHALLKQPFNVQSHIFFFVLSFGMVPWTLNTSVINKRSEMRLFLIPCVCIVTSFSSPEHKNEFLQKYRWFLPIIRPSPVQIVRAVIKVPDILKRHRRSCNRVFSGIKLGARHLCPAALAVMTPPPAARGIHTERYSPDCTNTSKQGASGTTHDPARSSRVMKFSKWYILLQVNKPKVTHS